MKHHINAKAFQAGHGGAGCTDSRKNNAIGRPDFIDIPGDYVRMAQVGYSASHACKISGIVVNNCNHTYL
jgi:hypothetical protein